MCNFISCRPRAGLALRVALRLHNVLPIHSHRVCNDKEGHCWIGTQSHIHTDAHSEQYCRTRLWLCGWQPDSSICGNLSAAVDDTLLWTVMGADGLSIQSERGKNRESGVRKANKQTTEWSKYHWPLDPFPSPQKCMKGRWCRWILYTQQSGNYTWKGNHV